MYYVDLPKSDGSKQCQTLASFIIKQQALDYAMNVLGADEHGNINVISDPGETETSQTCFVAVGSRQIEHEVIVSQTSGYEISLDFYPLLLSSGNSEVARISFHAFYSTTESRWHLVGHDLFASTYNEIIDLCCQQIPLIQQKNEQVLS